MVVTRSQADAAERAMPSEEDFAIDEERRRRISIEPPASPSPSPGVDVLGGIRVAQRQQPGMREHVVQASTSAAPTHGGRQGDRSPVRSVRSTVSTTTRARLAELEAEEKLAEIQRREFEIKRKELQLEAELVKKKLAADLANIQDEQNSIHEDNEVTDRQQNVNTWLQKNVGTPHAERVEHSTRKAERNIRFNKRDRSTTPGRTRSNVETLAEALEKLTRPRARCPDLQAFSGSPCEWLGFKAAFYDATKTYQLTPAENLQRLRSCLKGEARETVSGLLYTADSPERILKTLEQRYGRPEILVDKAMEDLRRITKPGPSAIELNDFAIKVQNVVCVLSNVGRTGYLYNPVLAREVMDKLSPHMRSRWCDYAFEQEGSVEPEIVVLSRFLMREADRALKFSYAPTSSTRKDSATRTNYIAINKKKGTAVYNVTEEEERCPSCEQSHRLNECTKYKALPTEERWKLVRDNKLCYKCIVKKHRRFDCKAKPCGVNKCTRPHHASLHQEKPETEEPACEATIMTVTTTSNEKAVLLKMCPVTVVGPRGEIKTLALLDEGATISLIDEDLARSIGAEGPSLPLRMRGVNTTKQENDSRLVTIKLRSHDNHLHEFRARTLWNMKLLRQSVPTSVLEQQHLRDLPRSVVCYESSYPGILVGADHWEYIVSQELRRGRPSEPAASRTQLGWVIHGTIPRSIISRCEDSVLHVHCVESTDKLHELVERHFRLDAVGISTKPHESDADGRARKIVEQTIKKTERGYEVGLPWKEDEVRLPPSYDMALRRLCKIEQRMDRDEDFKTQYTQQVENLLKMGYAEPCNGTEGTSTVSWFLPHFAVRNPNKPGKLRLVFDAAAKSRGVNLNDHLLEGPDLLRSLTGILFRFREGSIAVTADIKEMFLQIKIRPEDQPAQQFLWRGNNRERPPKLYKMTSMIFGAASSPFMAHYVRDYNARVHEHSHPLAFEAITRDHYMDDLVISFDEEDEARRAITELRTVHAEAGFLLRGWNSNRDGVLKDVPAELRAVTATHFDEGKSENKILGLYWNPERDELGFNTSMNRVPSEVRNGARTPTKREALSAVMSIFDPTGLLSHYTVRAKIILQSLWRLKISWDEPIPEEEGKLFATWLDHLTDLANLKLWRHYDAGDDEELQLHVMCDASEQAYAAVAYFRCQHPNGSVSVRLVSAKAKVAPRKTQTIPRLELQAAVIGARMADTIKREHRVKIKRVVYWSDSMTVIHWIRQDAKKYTPYVAHRLSEIAELTQKDEWRWIPTAENPADDATRMNEGAIREDNRWFQGPSFLRFHEDQWPSEKIKEITEEETLLHLSENNKTTDTWVPEPSRFSKYETLVRAAARVLTFVDRCRRRTKETTHQHIMEAERAILRRAQQESFPDELRRLEASCSIAKTSRLFRLDPEIEDGLLRVRGRIGAATAPTETKRPVILDGRHRITRLIVMREHCAAGHANRERVTNDLRQKYWIIHLRPTVRSVERECALCRLRKTKPQTPIMGDLPRARLEPFLRPFSNCGADYFGPMTVKIGRRREKRWGALFTCLTTRAVHIELVPSLSASSAIMALRRMAARRGWPRLMMSDNATNFRGADKELRDAYKEWEPTLRDEGLRRRMEWRFIPPGAPNQGGAWERMVRSVKVALAATLNEKVPTEEVLSTLLTEAEFSINARPLTHVSVDHRDPEALTPNHFLLGSSDGRPATGPCSEGDLRTWKASQALADQFWRRWIREYLPTLVPRGESTSTRPSLRIGDLVIVVDHALPRNVWPRGIVEKVYPGPDGGVRVADIRTKGGIFKRPASKLVVLKMEEASRATPGGGNVADSEN